MPSAPDLVIELLDPSSFEQFRAYLNDHLSDNGTGGSAHFQPLARASSTFPQEKADGWRNALAIPVGAPGWRRLWVARVANAPGLDIAGHIDLRAHPEGATGHRCLLGMGVDRRHRQVGLGARLLAHVQEWAVADAALEWIDLQVLSVNQSAIRLYHAAGFIKTGEIPEMFKIDGQLLSYTSMSTRLAPQERGPAH